MATKTDKPRSPRAPKAPSKKAGSWTEQQKRQIAERAYQRFLERGGRHGYELEDWLQAEAELKASLKPSKARRARATA